MSIDPLESSNSEHRGRAALMIAVGIALGLALGVLVYVSLNPALEGRDDWLEEFQGLLFNVVPLGAVAGGLLGWWASRRFRRRR